VPIGRPRRIFRSAFPRLLRRVATTAALALGVIGAGNWLAGLDWNSPGRAGLPERLEARAGQVAVVDGGTLRLQDRVVRLIGVAPPPRGESCRRANGTEVDCGGAAADALAGLVREGDVVCDVRATDPMGRPLATCHAGGTDISQAVVGTGWVRSDRSVPGLDRQEAEARSTRRGLWATEQSW
jgi:endonuclease YncB( thermonuclease family)